MRRRGTFLRRLMTRHSVLRADSLFLCSEIDALRDSINEDLTLPEIIKFKVKAYKGTEIFENF